MVHIGNDWDELLKDTFASENYQQLRQFLIREYSTHRVYPDMYDLFNALRYTSYADTRAVILGTGSLSPARAGSRSVLFRASRRCASPLFGEYVQGTAG